MFRYRPSFSGTDKERSGISVGKNTDGSSYIFPFSEIDSHTLVVGRTGSGKSSLLHECVTGLLRNGKNVVLLDPHGQLSSQVISHAPYADLIYFSTGDSRSGNRVKINPLSVSMMEDAMVVAGSLRDLLQNDRDLSMDTWGPRLQVIIGGLLPALLYERKVSSLNEFCMLLMDRKAMQNALTGIHNVEIASFVNSAMADQRVWREYVSSTINKLIGIISDISLSRVFGESDSFHIDSVLSGNSELMVLDFSKDQVSKSSMRAAFTLILARIWIAALRSRINETWIVIDEAQELSGSLMDNFLNEGRKFGIRLVLSSQSLNFFDERMSNSILSNAGNFFSFQTSRYDAQMLSGMFPQSMRKRIEDTLISLPPHECVHINRDRILEPIPGFTTSMVDPVNKDRLLCETTRSQEKYGAPEKPREIFITRGLDTHQTLTDRVRNFLSRLGLLEMQVFTIDGSRPDCIFTDSVTVFLGEIEVSDLIHPERVLKKLISYNGRKKLFFTENGDCSILYEMMLSLFERRKFNVDFENISIVERRNSRFYVYDGSKLRIPTPDSFKRGSFILRYGSETAQNVLKALSLLWNSGKDEIFQEDIPAKEREQMSGLTSMMEEHGGSLTIRKLFGTG
ncbi:MAG: type IV secretion system DNA-binding domain-containing protein [Candidatus Thermoplasmatota archaeon]|nr:type IV secretion system DNA-binding domain-containing protein [Candidatus Thermoplasmatota archaeon]MCL5730692.1 type IV secretion system DNA-binding domain-containing protein [Candidatus Thermoplasmatota archaeon]